MKPYVVKIDGEIKKDFDTLGEASSYSRSLRNVYEASGKTKKITVERTITKIIKEFLTNSKAIVKASELM